MAGLKKIPYATVALALLLAACAAVTVKQKPFDALKISANRPPPPPAPAKPPPRVVLTPSSIKITEKIQFAFDSAEIKPESFGLLSEIAQVMKDNPQIEVVQIEGHTDNVGKPEYNRKLSKARANSVREHLVKQGGIDAGRFVAEGFGPDRAMADNATDAGREQNRRVEFNIVKQSAKKTLVQD